MSFLVFFATTFTLHFNFFLPILAVIVAFPTFLPLILPFLETVTIFLLEDFHFTFLLFFFTFSFTVWPTLIVIFFLLSFAAADTLKPDIPAMLNTIANDNITAKILDFFIFDLPFSFLTLGNIIAIIYFIEKYPNFMWYHFYIFLVSIILWDSEIHQKFVPDKLLHVLPHNQKTCIGFRQCR